MAASLFTALLATSCGEGKELRPDGGLPGDGPPHGTDGLSADGPVVSCSFAPSGKPGAVSVTVGAPATLDTRDATAMNTLDHERNAQLAGAGLGALRSGPCGAAGLLLRQASSSGSAKLLYVDPTAGPGAPQQEVEPQADGSRHDASLFFDAACQPLVLRGSRATGYREYRRVASNWTATTVQADFSALLGGPPTALSHVASDVGADGKLYVFAHAEAGGRAWLLRGVRSAAAASSWVFEALPPAPASQLYVYRVDAQGVTHALFRNTKYPCDPCNLDFLHGTLPSGVSSWTTEIVAPGRWGAPHDELVEAADLAFAADGTPLVAAHFAERAVTGSYIHSELRLYGKPGATWCGDGVALASDGYVGADGAGFTGASPQILRDAGGHLHVLFQDQALWHDGSGQNEVRGQLRYALRVGDAWLLRTLLAQPGALASKSPLWGLLQPLFTVSPDGTKVVVAGVESRWLTDSIYNSTDKPASYAVKTLSVELTLP